ncbi:MAG TPA: hypothetical protein VL172_17090 [Kofleriaceae bacterium]|nr:hypothetical protein [Kofleriaceae bacterium]
MQVRRSTLAALALLLACASARAERLAEDPAPARAEDVLSPGQAASPAAARVVKVLLALRDGVRTTRYQHTTVIHRKDGFYGWDCSGMASWILGRSSTRAFAALRGGRAAAIDFYNLIARAPVAKRKRGWQRLAHVSEARPGDLFAFPRSPVSQSPVTGHVGFLVETPYPVPGVPGMYAVRVVDSTSYPHQHDSRGDTTTGFGFGTMVFMTDDTGEAVAYGWYGMQSRWLMPTHILFGRVW